MIEQCDVAVIGAGPAGSVAAKLLNDRGYSVVVIEQSHFPRFSIGESLLPQCMEFLSEAGMVDAVDEAGFQYKDGAVFARRGEKTAFDFREKFSAGRGTTYQVQRANFDKVLADTAEAAGVDIRYGNRIESIEYSDELPTLRYANEAGLSRSIKAGFVLDASGFGRVLPRLLDLEKPSDFPIRKSCFTHIEDRISDPGYDRNKILIAIHPEQKGVWYWLIPFSNGRASLGVVAEESYFSDETPELELKRAVSECPDLAELLSQAEYDTPVNAIGGYACKVKSLYGDRYALLGNAGEFLDPVFSSGVTIAMKSASLAVPLVDDLLQGREVDWQKDYADALVRGIDAFRSYVEAWYAGEFPDVIFYPNQQPEVREMICSILAGYAWDEANPYVANPKRLKTLVALCRS